MKRKLKTAIISDAWGYGLMEIKPYPLWLVRYWAIRNKALLVPEYGAMYVAAFLKGQGVDFQVINLLADVFGSEQWFKETREGLGEDDISTAAIGNDDALDAMQAHLRDSLADLQPDLVLFPISIYYVALHARDLIRRLKASLPDTTFVAGGVYSTMHPQEILEDGGADFVVRGEGEWTAWELWRAISAGESDFSGIDGLSWKDKSGVIVHNRDRAREKELDRFPHIYTVSSEFRIGDRNRLLKALNPFDDYIPGDGFLTSRGCPERCSFCLDPAVWKRKTYFHSPAYVREVLRYCWDNFPNGDRTFFFGDATFALNRPRLAALFEETKKFDYSYNIQTRADSLTPGVLRGLRDSNFTTVAIGAESLDDDILRDVVRKRTTREEILEAARAIREYGLKPIMTFIAGLPGEGRRSLERTVETLRAEGIRDATFFPLVVFKGTELYELFLKTFDEDEREKLRLNEWSEEFCFINDEFNSMRELIDYTQFLNDAIRA
jgi:radical SAM superfamily enzyme YgiQ (UPF0313 family)